MEQHSVDTRPYWEALQQKQLVIQKCGECGKHRHYPQPMCPHCHSTAVEWKQVSGNGTVHSWTIVYQTGIPGFVEQVPYAFVTVDLPEGVRVAAPLRQVGPEDIRIGLPVTLVFETAQDGTVVPAFVAATGIR